MAVFLFKPYYIRRRLNRWYITSGETNTKMGAQTFTLTVHVLRIPWWQFWRGWYGRR